LVSGREAVGKQRESIEKQLVSDREAWRSDEEKLEKQLRSDREAIGKQWESVGRTCNCLTIASQLLYYRLTLYNRRFYEKN